MKTTLIAACVALCLSACATTSGAPSRAQVDQVISLAQAGFQAAKTTVDADAQAGIIKADTARQIDGYIVAGDQALAAAQSAYAAGDAKTEQEKVGLIIQATASINNAILIAVQTYSAH
jgi:hypothetical protein